MSFYSIRKKELTDIADAIRAKTGKANGMTVEDMPKEIGGIESGNKESAKASISVGVPDIGNVVIVDVPISVRTELSKISDVLKWYNHELLPEIPAVVVEKYPYLLIMRSPKIIRLVASTAKAYYHTADDDKLRITVSAESIKRMDTPEAKEWLPIGETTSTYFVVNGDNTWAVWWSNYDIPNGSADAEDIYFPSSEPTEEEPEEATHFYYNGVKLPRLPDNALESYPYAWIRNNTTSGYYDLMLSDVPFYYLPSSASVEEGNLVVGKPWYRVPIATAETVTAWEDNTSNNTFSGWGINSTRTVLWSNHNIPNGSADATEIYFYQTLLVPTR